SLTRPRAFVTPRNVKRRSRSPASSSARGRKTCRERGRMAQRGGGGVLGAPMRRRARRPIEAPDSAAPNRSGEGAPASPHHRRGDTVCAEGDEGDTFFVCVSGELEVWGGAPRRIVNRLGPGEFFGEMSLLLGGQRAATVTASRNARLLAVDKSVFEQFFLHNAKVLEAFSRVLSKRLAKMPRGEVIAKTSTTIGVTGAPR